MPIANQQIRIPYVEYVLTITSISGCEIDSFESFYTVNPDIYIYICIEILFMYI